MTYSAAVRVAALQVAGKHLARAIGRAASLDVGECARELVFVFHVLGFVFGRSRKPAPYCFGAMCQPDAPRLTFEHARERELH